MREGKRERNQDEEKITKELRYEKNNWTDKRHNKTKPEKRVVDATDKSLAENRHLATATEDSCGYFTTPPIT